MAIKRKINEQVETPEIKVPEVPALPGFLGKVKPPAKLPGKTQPEYVYSHKGGEIRRFPKQTWEQMGKNKGGYTEIGPVPPEVLALYENKSS